jgi:pantothenate kinase
VTDLEPLLRRVADLRARAGDERVVVGVTGSPGAGKSTLCDALVAALGDDAVLVPMDGFHLAQAELERLGRADRKGAPDTFDAAGYLHLLRRLRARDEPVVYAPAFHRELEEAVAGAVAVPREVPVVVTEGNYLLLDDPAWTPVRVELDEVWFVAPDEALRLERLVARHVAHGRSPEAALEWVTRNDEVNARLVAATSARADLVVHGA